MFQSALLTIDGSETSLRALPALLQAIEPKQTEVTVLEVIDSVQLMMAHTTPAGFPMYAGGVLGVEVAEQAVEQQRAEAERHLADIARDLAQAGVEHVLTEIREGRPGDQIVNLVQERSIELVAMATHGRSGLRRAVLGSVADYVLRHADSVPMLLVRPHEG
jgi:nucleotide-binding universal stress UspA family protein